MIPIQAITHLEHHLRPVLARLLPADVFIKIYSASRNTYLKLLAKYAEGMPVITSDFYPQNLFVNSLAFRNDLGNAAGLDKDGSLLEFNYKLGAGYAIVGTALSAPHTGNLISAFGQKVNPWAPLTASSSALNSLGLPNKGIDLTLTKIKIFRDKFPDSKNNFPIGLSLMGHPLQKGEEQLSGLLESVRKSEKIADFLEINESCPNCNHNEDQELFVRRIKAIVKLRDSLDSYLPIILKLGSIDTVPDNIKLFSSLQIDGLALVNTQKNYLEFQNNLSLTDQKLFEFYTKKYQGGLSGQAIKQFAFKQVAEASAEILRQKSELKLIHVGGLVSSSDIITSRQLSAVVLREWYTGLLQKMGTEAWASIYQNSLANII